MSSSVTIAVRGCFNTEVWLGVLDNLCLECVPSANGRCVGHSCFECDVAECDVAEWPVVCVVLLSVGHVTTLCAGSVADFSTC